MPRGSISSSTPGSARHTQEVDAETTPLRNPELYQYDLNLADIAEVWRRGSVIASWLLDLTAQALAAEPRPRRVLGPGLRLGRGPLDRSRRRSTRACRPPCSSAALFARFSSRGTDDYADKLLSAMRFAFGGHLEKKA